MSGLSGHELKPSSLVQYVLDHVERGACVCGHCSDAVQNPGAEQPTGHTADLMFFKVAAKGSPDASTLRRLVSEHNGSFCRVDLFDGAEHNFMEIGGFVGDQGVALMLMGLGSLLGLWSLLTPRSVLGSLIDEQTAMNLATAGMVVIQAKREQVA